MRCGTWLVQDVGDYAKKGDLASWLEVATARGLTENDAREVYGFALMLTEKARARSVSDSGTPPQGER